MPAFTNIERSLYRTDEYVGYDGRGYPWRVFKVADKNWQAKPGPAHPYRTTAPTLRDTSLTNIARRLAERGAAPANA